MASEAWGRRNGAPRTPGFSAPWRSRGARWAAWAVTLSLAYLLSPSTRLAPGLFTAVPQPGLPRELARRRRPAFGPCVRRGAPGRRDAPGLLIDAGWGRPGRSVAAVGAAAAPPGWLSPWLWAGAPTSPADRLSQRDWVRVYRTLGIPQDSSREKMLRATERLRRKYANDQEALERVENANLWIMTKMLSRKEEAHHKRQKATRLSELGDSPRRLFKYIAGYIPPSIRQMISPPSMAHFRTSSGLLGVFALLGFCVPSQASNFVALGACATLGLVYQRNRPEPVKDEFGNVGEVRHINYREMLGALAVTALGVAVGIVLALGVSVALGTTFETTFCLPTCAVLWFFASFFKVYQCFDQQ